MDLEIKHRPRKIWLISDTHFRHRRLIEKGFRPADFEARIEKNWNRLVNPLDVVIHLGDVIVGREEEIEGINDRLNGSKILVRGNHDNRSTTWYVDRGFAMVVDSMTLGPCLLTHEPSEWRRDCRFNVCGHLHDDGHRSDEYDLVRGFHKVFSLEREDYCPILITKFIQSNDPFPS